MEWSVANNLKQLKSIYSSTVTMKMLKKELMSTKPYYLNEMGLSVYADGSEVRKSDASYMWGILKGWVTTDEEQLYVWTIKGADGKFKYINYGTRKDFDRVVAKRIIKTNKTK